MSASVSAIFDFDNSYARLPERFYASLAPTPVAAPKLIKINAALASELGVDAEALADPSAVEALAGNRPLAGAAPLAQVYAGHQFGGWSPQLGDGRAILIGEVLDKSGARRDVQLKGSGPTPFSRMGDGRAPLGPVLREYIVSEAMAALGVPTTRALAAVATGEAVLRETGPLPGAVLTRVAASHIRVGTFQYFSAREDVEALRLLTEHALARHYPNAEAETHGLALLRSVIAAQARLIAAWMGLGFIHGVMNTDNMTISGETIDFGPCAFMDEFDPEKVFSSIDQMGRYAYRMQPGIAHWNLSRLAVSLLPLLDDDEDKAIEAAKAALDAFPAAFEARWMAEMGRKIGLSAPSADDRPLMESLLAAMAAGRADFTLAFRRLADAESDAAALRACFSDPAAIDDWVREWRSRLAAEATTQEARRVAMLAANPIYIPRNHLVEEAIAGGLKGDFAPFEALNEVLAAPFDERPGLARYAAPPAPAEVVTQTFCGT